MSESTHQMDPTFYRSPSEAIAAPTEQLAYVVAFDRAGQQPDALTVLDTDPGSESYGQIVGWVDLDQTIGDELHHFGWNACSSALKHEGHDMGHDGLQRRYLLLPGLRSSNIHVYDTQPDPRSPVLHKMIVGRGAGREGRLLAAAHPALRSGRRLPHLPRGRRRPGGPRRDRAARPQHVRRRPGLGDRPRAAVPRLRRLVAPQPEHAGLQRVGHAVDDRERARPREAAGRQVRPPAALLGPRRGPAPADGRPRRRAADGPRAAAVARPGGHVGVRRCRRLDRRPVGLGLALAPRRR